jgi:TatD DNase family protein
MSPSRASLFDAHVHLQAPEIAARLDPILVSAREQGLAAWACNGSTEKDWPQVLDLGRRVSGIVPCFGLHPWYVNERSPGWLAALERSLDAIPSAVGEIGLDRWIEPRDERTQEDVFRAQLDVARRKRRPAMIHCLRAWGWLMEVLRNETPLPAGMLLHAYGGPVELIEPLAKMGAFFSFSGDTLDERKTRKREALRAVPHDRVLVETDAPDLPPPPAFRPYLLQDSGGKELNHPANLRAILRGLAKLRGETEEDLADAAWQNARRLMGDLLPAEDR